MNDEKRIRKLYGEKMWHLCRSLFPTILETPGLLSKLLEDHFNPTRFLHDDIVNSYMEEEFKDYIYSFIDVENNNQIINSKSVKELLNEAGYDFYECYTEEDIQTFKRYYAPGEALCTFHGGRLNRCFVFFALKKNVDEIKRENFDNPRREDEYGTSVISIQFTRGSRNTLSIKNRYNHTVNNPDATFSNNLENIISGLTEAFEREYDLSINWDITTDFELDGYVQAKDGKWYKYNYEINNIYYCPDNIIIDNFEVKRNFQEKEKYLVFDYFILDLVNNKIILYDNALEDSFVEYNSNIKKIDITNIENGKQIDLTFKDGTSATIIVNNANKITSYSNAYIALIKDDFLFYNRELTSINLPNVISIHDGFLFWNKGLSSINLPNVISIHDGFLFWNKGLSSINLPNATSIGNNFLTCNQKLTSINLPNVTSIGCEFLTSNQGLTSIDLPNVTSIGYEFLPSNQGLTSIDLPNVTSVGDCFLFYNRELTSINLPNVTSIGNYFLKSNPKLANTIINSINGGKTR